MFQGLHHCLLDDKGRVAFPAPLKVSLERHGAGDRFVLTQALYEPCLVAMPEKDFEALADKILALPPSNPAVVHFKRCVIAPATPIVIDKAGRVGIPKELREYAALERECVWAGVVEKIELWNRQRWDELRHAQSADELARTREYLERHGL